MPPDSVWSDQFNKSGVQLNLRGMGWKNLMNNCLLQAEVFKSEESINKNECSVNFDPNLVMDVRHKMIKGSSKTFPTPRGHIQSEAFKVLRQEYHDKLLRHKEEKVIEREIVKLRKILENHRQVIKKKLEETREKTKPSPQRTKPAKYHQTKGLEHCGAVRRLGSWLDSSVETKINQQEIPGKHVKVSVISQEQETDEIPEFAPSRKGSPIEAEKGVGRENEFWEEYGGRDEITRRYLGNDADPSEQGVGDDLKEEELVKHRAEVHSRMNERKIGSVLRKWRSFVDCKNVKTGNKIEGFLSRLRERKVKEGKGTTVGVGSGMKRQMWEKKARDEEAEEKLKKLMREVKSSQKEAHEKLQKARSGIEIEDKFLLRMEERRKERAKRRRDFEERKLKLEEEKERAERQREEEKKQKDEEDKRKRLEELKKKRRAEKEKREEQAREREKLRLAVAHHRVHLVRGYGLRPWVRLMRMRESQEQVAERFCERRLKEGALRRWVARVREQTELKVGRAVAFHEGMLKKNCLATWIEFRQRSVRQNQVAVDWHDLKVSAAAFKRWLQFTKTEQWERRIKSEVAAAHHQRKLKMSCMEKLREYPQLKKLERAKENRKWKWRQKVKEILPDYEPVNISDQQL